MMAKLPPDPALMFQRPVNHVYSDPVDLIWLTAANELGLTIERSAETFAAYDGRGKLTISTAEHFDADDSLAQMIFHEICHWLVAGRRGYHLEDWGLSNLDDRDLVYEYAAIRVQAALARPWGLRDFMAVTTDWRDYWDRLPEDTLAQGIASEDDAAIPLAIEAHHLSRLEPFASALSKALSATATVADLVRDAAPPTSLWKQTRARHRLGSLLCQQQGIHCGSCAWATPSDSGLRCRQHKSGETSPAVDAREPACERWERAFTIEDCASCGACCRLGFDILAIDSEDPFRQRHPELVQLGDHGELRVPRPEGFCVALAGDGSEAAPWRCRHYATRPGNCRDFEVAGDACLVARRRVGLSR